jgi:hypothetical protein
MDPGPSSLLHRRRFDDGEDDDGLDLDRRVLVSSASPSNSHTTVLPLQLLYC